MRDYAFDAIVFLYRGEPLHNAHKKIIDRALALGRHVIAVNGSDKKAVNTYNPWTTAERVEMTRPCFDEEDLSRMTFTAVRDYPYKNPFWLAEVHTKVRAILEKVYPESVGWSDHDSGSPKDLKIGIIGYKKDDTSVYLDWFPQWEFIDTASFSRGVSATDIRNSYFMEMLDNEYFDILDLSNPKNKTFLLSETLKEARERAASYEWRKNVPLQVAAYLEAFKTEHPERCRSLVSEHLHVLQKRFIKGGYPYPIIENTVDSVVTKNAHVLMVRRGEDPGKGQWALPGGYIGEFEDKFDAALRELMEETSIDFFHKEQMTKVKKVALSRRELIACAADDEEFGHPRRSTRGRVITRAFHFELPDLGAFPYIKGADDAAEAKWIPIGDLGYLEEQIFEDHLHIINHFVWKNGKKWRRG